MKFFKVDKNIKNSEYHIPYDYIHIVLFNFDKKSKVKFKFNDEFEIENMQEVQEFLIQKSSILSNKKEVYNLLQDLFEYCYCKKKESSTQDLWQLFKPFIKLDNNKTLLERIVSDSTVVMLRSIVNLNIDKLMSLKHRLMYLFSKNNIH